jgi:hypothetical protein
VRVSVTSSGRTFAAVVLLALTRSAAGTECIAVSLDVRRSKLVAREDWRSSPCAPREPLIGQTYVVARFADGTLQYHDYDRTTAERALIHELHVVTPRSILDVLQSYSSDRVTPAETRKWLSTAVIEPRREGSFSIELLDRAEDLVNRMKWQERCHADAIRSVRIEKLPPALRAIEQIVPAVDTEKEFVQRSSVATGTGHRPLSNDEAVEAWAEIVDRMREALGPLQFEVETLPWCD